MLKILLAILATLGALVVLALLFVVIAYIAVSRRLKRRMGETMRELETMLSDTIDATDFTELDRWSDESRVPPMHIHLFPSDGDPLEEDPLYQRIDQWLLEHRFAPLGDYTIDELDEELRIYLNEDRTLVAAIRNAADPEEAYVEFCFDLGNGQRGGVSNPPDTTLQLPAGSVGRHFRGDLRENFELLSQMWLEAVELLDAQQASQPVQLVDADHIEDFYEDAHAVEMECRIRAGGVTEEEVRASFSAQGITPTDNDIAEIQEQWQSAIEDHLLDCSERAQNFHDEGSEILVVYDRSVKSYLLSRMQDFLEQHSDENLSEIADMRTELEELLSRFAPRDALARFRPLLPKDLRYKLVDQLRHPIEADFYALPRH